MRALALVLGALVLPAAGCFDFDSLENHKTDDAAEAPMDLTTTPSPDLAHPATSDAGADAAPTGDGAADAAPTGDGAADAAPTGDGAADAAPTGDGSTDASAAADASSDAPLGDAAVAVDLEVDALARPDLAPLLDAAHGN